MCPENEETVSATASYDLLDSPTVSLVTYVEPVLNVTKISVLSICDRVTCLTTTFVIYCLDSQWKEMLNLVME